MGFPNAQNNPAGAIPVYLAGGAMLEPTPPTPFPATIGAGVTYSTGVMRTLGYAGLAVTAKLSQTGSLVLQRFFDTAGTIAIGDPVTVAMTADTQAVAYFGDDGIPAASWTAAIHNTSGSTGNLSAAAILMTG